MTPHAHLKHPTTLDRRQFALQLGARGLVAASALSGFPTAIAVETAEASHRFPPAVAITGSPRERGRQYGARFQADIAGFLDREIYRAFVGRPAKRDELLRYADACAHQLQSYSPVVHDEMTGIAEGTGLQLPEVTLISLHEELYHRGELPPVEHCTAVAVGPPDTKGGTFVGQTWDWMQSVFGLSRVVHWQRSEGPSVLAYGFPGMWCGAGLNSAGLALCWTSADLGNKGLGVRIGIPSYALLTHFLYQPSLDEVAEEARRATNAGWFTFVMADGQGNLLNIEGSPRQIAVEKATGRLVRVGFGSRAMSENTSGPPVRVHPRCARMQDLLSESSGRIDLRQMQRFFEDPACQISVGKSTIDMMVFDCTARAAYCSRGPSYTTEWQRFTFT